MIDPVGLGSSVSNAYAVTYSGAIEGTERVPDNEAIEKQARAKAPLEAYQGNSIDVEA